MYESRLLALMLPRRFEYALEHDDVHAAVAAVERLHVLAAAAVLYDHPVVLEDLHDAATSMLMHERIDTVEAARPGIRDGLHKMTVRAAAEAERLRGLDPPQVPVRGRHRWMLSILAERDEPASNLHLAAAMGMGEALAARWSRELRQAGLIDPGLFFRQGKNAITERGLAAIKAPGAAAPSR